MNIYGFPDPEEPREARLINEESLQKMEVLNKDGRIGSPMRTLSQVQSSQYILMDTKQQSKIRIQKQRSGLRRNLRGLIASRNQDATDQVSLRADKQQIEKGLAKLRGLEGEELQREAKRA